MELVNIEYEDTRAKDIQWRGRALQAEADKEDYKQLFYDFVWENRQILHDYRTLRLQIQKLNKQVKLLEKENNRLNRNIEKNERLIDKLTNWKNKKFRMLKIKLRKIMKKYYKKKHKRGL
jgi:peptidoglycan hydrolase CwlO-like protein